MGHPIICNLNARVIEQLKAQAKANRRSLEEEIRHVLTQWVGRPGRIADFREWTRGLLSLTAGKKTNRQRRAAARGS